MAGVALRPKTIIILTLSLGILYLLLRDTLFPPIPAHVPTIPHPQPGQPHFTRHIVAVGDLHGHLPNARRVLQMSGVIDEDDKWTGNVDYLAQTGDIVDRGDDTLALYRLMEYLRIQARAAGGDVLSHLGNHEIMNAIGDWRYVYESEVKTFGTVADRQRIISTGWVGQAWAKNYSITSRLPLHPSLGPPNTDYSPSSKLPLSHSALSFVHGGISPTFGPRTPYPSSINTLGATLLHRLQTRKQPPPHPPAPYPGLPSTSKPDELSLYGEDGPLWYRGWALKDEKTVCAQIDGVLEEIGVRRLVMGHTPDFEKIVSRCGGKIIIIDTGITPAYGGILSALDIKYTLTPIESQLQSFTPLSRPFSFFGYSNLASRVIASARDNDKSRTKWVEEEIVTAVYVDRRVELVREAREVVGDFW